MGRCIENSRGFPIMKVLRLLPCLLALSPLACSSASDPASDEVGAEQALKNRRACEAPFFAQHPHTGSATLASGAVVQTPFWACDVDLTAIFGTVTFEAIAPLVQGTGLLPVATTVAGQ